MKSLSNSFRLHPLAGMSTFLIILAVSTGCSTEEKTESQLESSSIVKLINSLAGAFGGETELASPTTIEFGNLLPSGSEAFELEGGKEAEHTFKIQERGTLGEIFDSDNPDLRIIDMEYTISYDYDRKLNGKGHYMSGLTFSPSFVDVASMVDFGITNLSSSTTVKNLGSKEDPYGELEFWIEWKTMGLFGTIVYLKYDKHTINTKTGELKSKLGEWR